MQNPLLELRASQTNNACILSLQWEEWGRAQVKGTTHALILYTAYISPTPVSWQEFALVVTCRGHQVHIVWMQCSPAVNAACQIRPPGWEALHNVFLLLFSGQGETCITTMGHGKLLLTKYWNEVLDQFKVATVSSNVQGISTILFTQDGNTQNTCLRIDCSNTSQHTVTSHHKIIAFTAPSIYIYIRRAVILCSQTPPVACLRWM